MIKIYGLNALQQSLKAKAKVGDINRVVRVNGSEMQRYSMRIAPVDTGFLRANIMLYIEGGGIQARMKSEAYYAVYQEYGTRQQPGTPHVRPAFYRQRPIFLNDLKKLINK